MEYLKLPTQIMGRRGYGLPLRQLALTCDVINPSTTILCILVSWVRVETKQGLRIAEGPLLHPEYALSTPPGILPRQHGTAIITIPFPDRVLMEVEQRRKGNDLELVITSQVIALEVKDEVETISLSRPVSILLEDGHIGRLEYTIPQSEWVKALKEMQWSEMILLEFPSRDIRSDTRLARAFECLEEGQACYRKGLWDETALNCRKVFEAIVQDTTGEENMGKALDALNAFIHEPSKANLINQIAKDLGVFLQLGRHEKLPVIPFTPNDAALALQLTTALLSYLITPAS
jgi:hypothetical protein